MNKSISCENHQQYTIVTKNHYSWYYASFYLIFFIFCHVNIYYALNFKPTLTWLEKFVIEVCDAIAETEFHHAYLCWKVVAFFRATQILNGHEVKLVIQHACVTENTKYSYWVNELIDPGRLDWTAFV